MSAQPAARSAGAQCPEREAEQAFAAEQEHAAAAREQPRDGGVAHIEPAGIGAERRHHQRGARRTRSKGGSRCRRVRAPPPWGGGGRRSRPARPALAWWRKTQRGGGEGFHPLAADALWRRGIVVALDPDETVRLGHGAETGALARRAGGSSHRCRGSCRRGRSPRGAGSGGAAAARRSSVARVSQGGRSWPRRA